MFSINLQVNGVVVIPQNLYFAQNITSFSSLRFTLLRNRQDLSLQDNISNTVELDVNNERLFTGYILNSNVDNVNIEFDCVPTCNIVNVTHMPNMLFNQDLEQDLAPKQIITRALAYPNKIFEEQLDAKAESICEFEIKDVGEELVRIDLFGIHTETPGSLINSILSNRNVIQTNDENGRLIIGTLPSIYGEPETHEVTSYINYNSQHDYESIKSAYGINTPIVITGRFGSPATEVISQDFLNIKMTEIKASTYPLNNVLHNLKTKDNYNFCQVNLESLQSFNLGDIIKNNEFSMHLSSFLVTGKQLNLDSDKMSYQYILRHEDSLSVI